MPSNHAPSRTAPIRALLCARSPRQALRARSLRPALRMSHAFSAAILLSLLAGCLSRSLTSLQISPATGTVTIVAGQTSQFQAQGIYTESGHATTSQDVTSEVSWQSSNPSVATIDGSGLATGVSAGSATITANLKGSFSALSATSTITVTAAPGGGSGGTPLPRVLSSLVVIPGTQTVFSIGEITQLIAIGTYSSGSPLTADVTDAVSWRSSDASVAVVNGSGQATAVGGGQATITALATSSDGSVTSATATLTENSLAGSNLPVLTVYNVGNGAGDVTGTANGVQVISCTSTGGASSTGCVGSFPLNQSVTLSATAATGSHFDGWSLPCAPQPDTSNTCTVTLTGNTTVGAIFDQSSQ